MPQITCSLSGGLGIVDGVDVVFVKMGFQKRYRKGASEGSQTLAQCRTLPTNGKRGLVCLPNEQPRKVH